MLKIGDVLEGKYEVTEKRRVHQGEVSFHGRQVSGGREVQIYAVAADAPDEVRRSFSNAAQHLGRISHMNCLSALCVGQNVRGTLYVVSDAAPGGTLEEHVGESMPARELAEVGSQLCSGLSHLHAQGILVGCLLPSGVLLGLHDGAPRLQIVDLSFAQNSSRSHGHGSIPAEWRAPELDADTPYTESSDVYAAGALLRALATSDLPAPLESLLDQMTGEVGDRPTAAQAASAFEEFALSWPLPFDNKWIPSEGFATISTSGVPTAVPRTSTTHLVAPASFEAEEAHIPEPSKPRYLGLGLAAAGVAAAALIGFAVMSQDADPKPVADASVAQGETEPEGAAVVAQPAPSPLMGAAVMEADVADGAGVDPSVEGNPILWLNRVNRQDLGAVIKFEERHVLLERLSESPAVYERVNHRWNALLDLWQANDSERPCATFAEALATLEESPETDIEKDLVRRVVVPNPASDATGDDASCEGLADAFQEFAEDDDNRRVVRRSRKKSTSSKPAPAPKPAPPSPEPAAVVPDPTPVKPTKPAKKKSQDPVASKLDDGLRDF